jgi:16S rRNA (guanine527-N7)-methyltransferase
MSADPVTPELLETLRLAQRFGFFGDRAVEHAAKHSVEFVTALGDLPAGSRLIDLGSGGGLPGLVLASAYPECELVLLDRRTKRTDFLERAVRRHGWRHVAVWCGDATDVVRAVGDGSTLPFDVVTARGFGPPEFTLRTAMRLLAGGGRVVISEPPEGDRWDPTLLAELGVRGARRGAVRVFTG